MPETTSRYFVRRSLAHMEKAARAANPSVAEVHRSLAREYHYRAFEEGVSPEGDIDFRAAP